MSVCYTYDAAGNRITKTDAQGQTVYQYNQKNQLLFKKGTKDIKNFTYDAQGGILEEKSATGEARRFTYNSKHQQTRVETEDRQVQENRYDAEGLRFELLENGKHYRFVYHQGEILHEKGGDESQTSYHLGAGIEAFQRGRDYYYYHRDEQLNTAFITGSNGCVQNSYQYDAFGSELEKTELLFNRIRYTGQQYDTLTEQYYLRARYYNPALGRFMQEDVYQGDGLNLYEYCHNNPVRYYDSSGYGKKKTNECLKEEVISEAADESDEISIVQKTVINSAGQEVTRSYVKGEDDLLKVAERAAGGDLDKFKELKDGWYINEEKTIKIELNLVGHANTNEGPHVTVREINDRGGWTVKEKYFIDGRDTYK